MIHIIGMEEKIFVSATDVSFTGNRPSMLSEGSNIIEKLRYNQSDIRKMTSYINYIRRNAKPQPSNMRRLVWSENLAKLADEWAINCQNKYGPVGCLVNITQLIYYEPEWNRFQSITPFRKWNQEEKNYDYHTNRCINGSCDNYKKLIGYKSHSIGCSRMKCGTDNIMDFVVCNIYPEVNLRERLYKTGRQCECILTENDYCEFSCDETNTKCLSLCAHQEKVPDKILECKIYRNISDGSNDYNEKSSDDTDESNINIDESNGNVNKPNSEFDELDDDIDKSNGNNDISNSDIIKLNGSTSESNDHSEKLNGDTNESNDKTNKSNDDINKSNGNSDNSNGDTGKLNGTIDESNSEINKPNFDIDKLNSSRDMPNSVTIKLNNITNESNEDTDKSKSDIDTSYGAIDESEDDVNKTNDDIDESNGNTDKSKSDTNKSNGAVDESIGNIDKSNSVTDESNGDTNELSGSNNQSSNEVEETSGISSARSSGVMLMENAQLEILIFMLTFELLIWRYGEILKIFIIV